MTQRPRCSPDQLDGDLGGHSTIATYGTWDMGV